MAGLFFVPVAGCFDKVTGASSFAHTVAQLRSRSGRLDPSLLSQNWKCDYAAVGLYGSGEPEEVRNGVPRGVARSFPIVDDLGRDNSPPRRQLPLLSSTLSLDELIGGSSPAPYAVQHPEHRSQNLAMRACPYLQSMDRPRRRSAMTSPRRRYGHDVAFGIEGRTEFQPILQWTTITKTNSFS